MDIVIPAMLSSKLGYSILVTCPRCHRRDPSQAHFRHVLLRDYQIRRVTMGIGHCSARTFSGA